MSYSKQLYATVLRICTAAVDPSVFYRHHELEQKWLDIVDAPVFRTRWTNEALEFLGDGVVNACIITDICACIDGPPSMLSMLKSILTSNILFAAITTSMIDKLHFPLHKLNSFLNIPKHDTVPTKSFADAFETVIGQLYRDKGFTIVQTWISAIFKPIIKAAIEGYRHFRATGPGIQSEASGPSSGKRKRGADDQSTLNKRPKFMSKPPSVPVIIDAGSGSDASLIQDLALALERRIQKMYTKQRDAFLWETIADNSLSSQHHYKHKPKAKGSIERKLFEHGKKYIRMMLAINDRVEDYPLDVEATEASNRLTFSADAHVSPSHAPLCFTPLKARGQATPTTPLDLEIREIELIDLVDDSEDSDADTEDETEDENVPLLSCSPTGLRMQKPEVIDLVSSSESEDESDSASFSCTRKGKRRMVDLYTSDDDTPNELSDSD